MKNAKLSVISFNDNDVIATSGGLTCTLAGFGNGVYGDGYATRGISEVYYFANYDRVPQDEHFNLECGVNTGLDTVFYVSEELSDTFMNICLADCKDDIFHQPSKYDAANSAYNGNYLWDGTKFVKQTN